MGKHGLGTRPRPSGSPVLQPQLSTRPPFSFPCPRQEFDRKKVDELLNIAASCRRVTTHRTTLQKRAIRE